MNLDVNRKWTLASRPQSGPLSLDCFRFEEEALRDLKDGEFRVRTTMLSFDPTQRFWMERDTYVPKIPLGDVIRGAAVGEVVQSKNADYPVHAKVAGLFGWQSYALCNGHEPQAPYILPEGISDEAALSIFGMTGLTGYFGMLDVGKVKAGDTVLVSGASGATGSIAAQIAKIKGAKVIGIAGSDEKCHWLTEKAHLDAALNYKTQDLNAEIGTLAPKGIDVYFDNVGGNTLDCALAHLAMNARVVLCGAISTYDGTANGSIKNYLNLVLKRAIMQGFLIFDYKDQFRQAIVELAQWNLQGQLCYEVDIQQGIENAPQTLKRLFAGQNLGKQLLKV